MNKNDLQSVRYVLCGKRGRSEVVEWYRLHGNPDKWKVMIVASGEIAVTTLRPNLTNTVYFFKNMKTAKG